MNQKWQEKILKIPKWKKIRVKKCHEKFPSSDNVRRKLIELKKLTGFFLGSNNVGKKSQPKKTQKKNPHSKMQRKKGG